MQDLKVIGVENGALVAVGDDGERFRIAVDEALQSKVRQVRQETPADAPIQEWVLREIGRRFRLRLVRRGRQGLRVVRLSA